MTSRDLPTHDRQHAVLPTTSHAGELDLQGFSGPAVWKPTSILPTDEVLG